MEIHIFLLLLLPTTVVSAIDVLTVGSTLAKGNQLTSTNGMYRCSMQPDGNLVVYAPDNRVLWKSNTANIKDGLKFQSDGNLVLYQSSQSRAVWSSRTNGRNAARLVMRNDGNLVLYGLNNEVFWATNTAQSIDVLTVGSTLETGYQLTSKNGRYRCSMQPDGNLVVYAPHNRVLWSSRTANIMVKDGLKFQRDGNLVLYRSMSNPVWSSRTTGQNANRLVMKNDGNLVLYRKSVVIWATNTAQSIDVLTAGSTLLTGDELTSPNGKYRCSMRDDGNLVVYAPDYKVLWESNTANINIKDGLKFQRDGNLVLYRSDGRAMWSSNTYGIKSNPPDRLVMQNDGNLVLYGSYAHWSTKPVQTPEKKEMWWQKRVVETRKRNDAMTSDKTPGDV